MQKEAGRFPKILVIGSVTSCMHVDRIVSERRRRDGGGAPFRDTESTPFGN
jgi:hypothetical protein